MYDTMPCIKLRERGDDVCIGQACTMGPLLLALAGCCVLRARRMKKRQGAAPGARSKASGTGMWPMGAELAEVVVAGASPGGRGRSVKDQ